MHLPPLLRILEREFHMTQPQELLRKLKTLVEKKKSTNTETGWGKFILKHP